MLIHSSNGIPPGAKRRRHGRGFQPVVIDGGARARRAPRKNSWEAALDLIDLGFVFSVAFLQASITVLDAYNRTDP
jgi:hypothetical protein